VRAGGDRRERAREQDDQGGETVAEAGHGNLLEGFG
jgi:hypothetical protein